MKLELWLKRILVFLITLSANGWLTEAFNSRNPNYKGTYKETSQKDGYYARKQISEVIDKLEVMESKMDVLEKDIEILSSKVDGNTNILEDLQETALADANYWNYTDHCGGVVFAQTGKINPSLMSSYRRCLWTIHANHRSQIKLNLIVNLQNSNPWTSCKVTEFLFGQTGPGGPQSLKTTEIKQGATYLFRGPIILVLCFVPDYSSSFITFEGIGPVVYKNFAFRTLSLFTSNGSLDLVNKEIESKPFQFQYNVLTIKPANEPSKLSVQGDSASQDFFRCRDNSSFYMYQDFTDSSAPVYNCCEMDCRRKKFLIVDHFFLVLVLTSSANNNTSLKLSWIPDEISLFQKSRISWASLSMSSCGGVFSGQTSGFVSYSVNQNNKRCIWAILPFPKTKIELITGSYNFVDSSHDYVVAVEIDGKDPITTRVHPQNKYNLTGRVILIMLYTDNTILGGYVNFNWKSISDIDVSDQFAVLSDDSKIFRGTSLKDQTMFNTSLWSPITNKGFHTFVINPQDIGPHSLNLTINHASLEGKVKLRVLGSKDINFTTIFESDENVANRSFESWDGVAVLVLDVPEDSSNGSFQISWDQGKSTLPAQYNSCGGIVNAVSGSINYYPGSIYPSNDRCIWVVFSNASKITLTLRKNGFGCCNDKILVDLIDLNDGTIVPNRTSVLSSTNLTQTLDGPLLLITFQSDSSGIYAGSGFVLDFNSSGTGNTVDVSQRFRLIHRNEKHGMFVYPSLDEEPLKQDEILILAYSRIPEIGSVEKHKASKILLTLNIDSESTERRFNTDLDELNIYSHAEGFKSAVKCSLSYGNPEDECEFNAEYQMEINGNRSSENFTNTLSGSEFNMGIKFSAFLMTYKPASSETKALAFNLTWEDDNDCGGILISESGVIEYKLFETYNTNEFCVWIVASGKQSILFNMESSGVREPSYYSTSCDQVVLTEMDPTDGTLGYPFILRGNRRLEMTSSVVIVTFYSDLSIPGTGFKLTWTSRPGLGDRLEKENKFQFRPIVSKKFDIRSNTLTVPGESQLPMKHNELIILSFNPLKGISGPTTVSLHDINMFVNETCTTDSLRFYNFGLRSRYYSSYYDCDTAQKSYSASSSFRSYSSSSVCSSNQTSSDSYDYNNQYTEPECQPECYQTDVLSTSTTKTLSFSGPFLAIYKSVTDQTKEKTAIKFEWERTSEFRKRQTLLLGSTTEENDEGTTADPEDY